MLQCTTQRNLQHILRCISLGQEQIVHQDLQGEAGGKREQDLMLLVSQIPRKCVE